jgi:hypothetical protein
LDCNYFSFCYSHILVILFAKCNADLLAMTA